MTQSLTSTCDPFNRFVVLKQDSEKTSLTAPSAELTEKDVNDAEQVVPEAENCIQNQPLTASGSSLCPFRMFFRYANNTPFILRQFCGYFLGNLGWGSIV